MRKIGIILSTIAICSLLFFFLWTKFLWRVFKSNYAGSYEYAEIWNFKIKESKLIQIIRQIKKEHPELEVPNYGLPTEIKDGNWYHIVFYYNDTNQNIYTWLRSNADSSLTSLAFISIAHHNSESTSGKDIILDSKEINRDFEYFENKRQVKKFEEKIVDLIRKKVNNHAL